MNLKKLFFVSFALICGTFGFAQNKIAQSRHILPAELSKRTVTIDNKTNIISGYEIVTPAPLKENNYFVSAHKNINDNLGTVIGGTTYDLQSNGSVDNHRIYKYDDGTVAGIWTYSNSGSLASPDRGTGYNYYDGTSWGAFPNAAIESKRVGWGTMAPVGSNEYIISHDITTAGISFVAYESPKGGTSWATAGTPTPIAQPILWPRVASDGPGTQNLYMIGLTLPTGNAGAVYQGLDGAVVFTKSADAGVTWDALTILPGMESSDGYYGYAGDGYAIDVKGNTVVIASFGDWYDTFILKSADGGNTWTKTMVWTFPIANYDYIKDDQLSDINSDGVADSILSTDHSGAVIIGDDGKANVFFGLMRVLNDSIGGGASSYFPNTDGLIYWKEGMQTIENGGGVRIAEMVDVNGNDSIDFNTVTSPALPFGGYFLSLSSMPNVGIDDLGNLYVSYSSVTEGSDYSDGRSFRNIYVVKHMVGDNDTVWSDPYNLTKSGFTESIFASMNRRVDGNIHLLFQNDYEPGLVIRGPTPNPNTSYYVNDIRYMSYDVNLIVGNNEISSENFNVSQNFPNPFYETSTIVVNLTKPSDLSMTITNIMGQKVYEINQGHVNAGNYNLTIDGGKLNSGIYFYTVRAGNSSVTHKMIVE